MPEYVILEDAIEFPATVSWSDTKNSRVEIVKNLSIGVSDGLLVLGVVPESVTRNGMANIRFSLRNSGDEAIEIITAMNQHPSPDISVRLKDSEGNVLGQEHYQQILGADVFNRGSVAVAQIQPQEIFDSEPIEISVPENCPGQCNH